MGTGRTKAILIDIDVLREIESTNPGRSIRRHVNELLKIGLEVERAKKIDEEISTFFAGCSKDPGDSAFQQASRKALSRG
jgi:hypothetical protein